MMSFVMPKTLKVGCDIRVRAGKWSSLEPHSWTIKQRSVFVKPLGSADTLNEEKKD